MRYRLFRPHDRQMVVVIDDPNIELMASTGLVDRNGTEIFEGDLIDVAGVTRTITRDSYPRLQDRAVTEVVGNRYEGVRVR